MATRVNVVAAPQPHLTPMVIAFAPFPVLPVLIGKIVVLVAATTLSLRSVTSHNVIFDHRLVRIILVTAWILVLPELLICEQVLLHMFIEVHLGQVIGVVLLFLLLSLCGVVGEDGKQMVVEGDEEASDENDNIEKSVHERGHLPATHFDCA